MPESQQETGLRTIASALLLFVAGFAGVAFLLHLTLRNPLRLHADIRSEKLAMLERLGPSATSAAFGSSHVHNGFDPRVFDAVLAHSQQPVHTHTLNLAVAGGSQSEQRVLALDFLAQLQPPSATAPPPSCMVLLELNAGANFLKAFLVHPRTIDIYDWPTTRFITHLTSPQMPRTQRAGRITYALAAMGLHYMNVGMFSNLIFAPPLDAAALDDDLRDDHRGLMLLGDGDAALAHEFAIQPRTMTAQPLILTPGNSELLHELQAAIPGHTIAFVYVMYPKLSDLTTTPISPDHVTVDGRDFPVINLARPDRFPELYQLKFWHDGKHLNGAGASLATRLLAQQLVAWYAAHGGAPACSS